MSLRSAFLPAMLFFSLPGSGQWLHPPTPERIYGNLFTAVQMDKVFPDGKTFVDCVPARKPVDIMYDYGLQEGQGFDLKKFVAANFVVPRAATAGYVTDSTQDVFTHIRKLWTILKRKADTVTPGSSLLPLPYPYIVPGGRFREVYYWDSYFTMLGLKESGEAATIHDMVSNFAFLIDQYGHIPNGNRTYYLGRSQPPFFSCMVELLASVQGDSIYRAFLPAMVKEYAFWMDGSANLHPGEAFRRVVRTADGGLLNRYFDDSARPRQESYREDVLTADKSGRDAGEMYRNLRACAESGLDFSSRWFRDNRTLATVAAIDLLPVDLNCLLYHLEVAIARARRLGGDPAGARLFEGKSARRAALIQRYFWNTKQDFYTDFNFRTGTLRDNITPAGLYPFCFLEEKRDSLAGRCKKAARVAEAKLLKPGGFSTSEFDTGEQWDAPNGWAPLEWMMIWGLDRCGQKELAETAARRWMRLNIAVYRQTGKLMEKYNVADISKTAGGGEYDGQDGFGWTNGVLLKLAARYGPGNP